MCIEAHIHEAKTRIQFQYFEPTNLPFILSPGFLSVHHIVKNPETPLQPPCSLWIIHITQPKYHVEIPESKKEVTVSKYLESIETQHNKQNRTNPHTQTEAYLYRLTVWNPPL